MAYKLKIGNYHFQDWIGLNSGNLRIVNWAWDPASPTWKVEYVPSIYGPSAASIGYEQPITDAFTLAYFGCDEDAREVMVDLKRMVSKIVQYHGETEFPYWLWMSTEGELGRRSLLYNAVWKPQSRPGAWPMLGTGKIIGQLALTRHPLWEDAVEFTNVDVVATGLSTCGGIARLTDMPGTAPARMQRAEWNALPVVGNTTNTLVDIWAGFRREDDGTTDFVPKWECEQAAADSLGHAAPGGMSILVQADGANWDVFNYDDANASNVHAVDIDFHHLATLGERFYIPVYQVFAISGGTNYGHMAGEYLVLLRAKLENATYPAEVQMRSGYRRTVSPFTEGMYIHDYVPITTTAYKFYELGEIRIPCTQLWFDPTGENNYEQEVYHSALSIWASGTATFSLYCDCLVLIPTSFFCRVRNGAVYTDTTPMAELYHKSIVVTEPDERVFGVNSHTADYIRGVCTPETKRWYIPEGNSMMVVAAQAAAIQDLNDLIWGQISYASRWEDYRIPGTLTVV